MTRTLVVQQELLQSGMDPAEEDVWVVLRIPS
jgi:hypothetical protein